MVQFRVERQALQVLGTPQMFTAATRLRRLVLAAPPPPKPKKKRAKRDEAVSEPMSIPLPDISATPVTPNTATATSRPMSRNRVKAEELPPVSRSDTLGPRKTEPSRGVTPPFLGSAPLAPRDGATGGEKSS